jgi:hypothetical protein
VGKKKKKLKKRCCGKFLKEGKHCKNCPILLKESISETGADPRRKKRALKRRKRKKKKKKKPEKRKRNNVFSVVTARHAETGYGPTMRP